MRSVTVDRSSTVPIAVQGLQNQAIDANPVIELDEARGLQLLATVSLGRLVTVTIGHADSFPVSYPLSADGKV